MRHANAIGIIIAMVLWALLTPAYAVHPDLVDDRYVTEVSRYSSGHIKRSIIVKRAFKRIHPCPSTGLTYGRCPGWQIDHVIPLACGGRDAVSNMQWLPVEIKTCAGKLCKDRFERKIYGLNPPVLGAGNCKQGVVK
jgi:hypothetical protein